MPISERAIPPVGTWITYEVRYTTESFLIIGKVAKVEEGRLFTSNSLVCHVNASPPDAAMEEPPVLVSDRICNIYKLGTISGEQAGAIQRALLTEDEDIA